MSMEAEAVEDSNRDDYIGFLNIVPDISCWTATESLYCVAAFLMLYGVSLNGTGGYFLYTHTPAETVLVFVIGAGAILSAAVLLCIALFGYSPLWLVFPYIEIVCVLCSGTHMIHSVKDLKIERSLAQFRAAAILLACQVFLIFILIVAAVVMWILGKDFQDDKDTTPIAEE